jgi:hypothetical protein
LKELESKGYFIRADGTKSTDVEQTGKKRKSAKSPKKGTKKSALEVDKSMKAKSDKKRSAKKEAKKGK